MNLFHALGYSSQLYHSPVVVSGKKPKTYLQLGFRSPAHKGPFLHAEDLVVPDPRQNRLPVYAPYSGKVVALSRGNTQWGPNKNFQQYLNFVTVQVTGDFGIPGSEFYELAHVDFGDCTLKVGDRVNGGLRLGFTGLNGYITVSNGVVDSHLHFMVGVWLGFGKFKSVRIRYR